MLVKYFGGAVPMPRVSMQLGSTEAVKQAVKAGLGISLVLASSVVDEVKTGSLRAIPFVAPPLHKELFVAWRNGLPGLPAPAFAQHLLQRASDSATR